MESHRLEFFERTIENYAKENKKNPLFHSLDMPQDENARTKISRVCEFINDGLSYDVPVVFLNSDNGRGKVLEHWHWVTIIGLDLRSNADDCYLENL